MQVLKESQLLVENTPWEPYDVAGCTVHVKREDLCCPSGPRFSKIRGLIAHLSKYPSGTSVGILDTIHSKAGWGVAWVCKEMKLRCFNFYPTYSGEMGLRPNQQRAQELGAILIPVPAGRSSILLHLARRQLKDVDVDGIMLPNGLQLTESVFATIDQVLQTPRFLFGGTWVVSVSTGTIAEGVRRGLEGTDTDLIAHMGYSHSQKLLRQKVGDGARIIDEGYEYRDSIDFPVPFSCNPWYDLKAWKWLTLHVHELREPIVFWNIGD